MVLLKVLVLKAKTGFVIFELNRYRLTPLFKMTDTFPEILLRIY